MTYDAIASYVITLTPEERRAVYKASDVSEAFIQKGNDLCKALSAVCAQANKYQDIRVVVQRNDRIYASCAYDNCSRYCATPACRQAPIRCKACCVQKHK